MAFYNSPTITFTTPHVVCREVERTGIPCYEGLKDARVIIAGLGTDKIVLLVCDTVDGSTIEDPPTVIAQVFMVENRTLEIELSSSVLKIRFVLPKIHTFELTFGDAAEFWDVVRIIADTQATRVDNEAKEEELLRGVVGMVPCVPRSLKQEE